MSRNRAGGGLDTDGTTEVFGPDGALLYEIPVFTGRRAVHLSPDGSVVVLDGCAYFGTQVMRSTRFAEEYCAGGGQKVASIYLRGKLWREIAYETDLEGPPVPERFGGGWAWRRFTVDVNWERNVIVFNWPCDILRCRLPGRRTFALPGEFVEGVPV